MLKKITLLIIIVGFLPLVLGILFNYIDYEKLFKNLTGNELENLAQLTAKEIDGYINDKIKVIEKNISDNEKTVIDDVSSLIGADIINVSLQNDTSLNKTVEGMIYDSKKGYLFNVYLLKDIKSANKKIGLKITLQGGTLMEKIKKVNIGKTGQAVIFTSSNEIFGLDKNRIDDAVRVRLLKYVLGLKYGWVIIGDNIFGFAPIDASFGIYEKGKGEFNWYVLVNQKYNDAFKRINELLIRSLLLGISLIALIAIVGGYIAYRFIRPIQLLRNGARLIGEGNLEQRLEIRTKDEIEQLANEFNNMAVRLKDFYADLENKVYERTKELEETQQQVLSSAEELEYVNAQLEDQAKELRKLAQTKSDFVSMVSHELRTPLTSMKEAVTLVLDGSAGAVNEKQTKLLVIARDSIERLIALINDILDISKIEMGRMEMRFNNVLPEKLLKDTLETMQPHARAKNITLSLETGSELPLVYIDVDRIVQVLTNLINNAIKFTPESGKVTVFTEDSCPGHIKISIADTGVGIKKEDINKLFTKFEQLEGGMTRRCGGSGLGLAIAREIIRLHGGEIFVESEYEKGSVFFFTIPKSPRVICHGVLRQKIRKAEIEESGFSLVLIKVAPEAMADLEERVKRIIRHPTIDYMAKLSEGELYLLLDADKTQMQAIFSRIKQSIGDISDIEISALTYPEDISAKELLEKIVGG